MNSHERTDRHDYCFFSEGSGRNHDALALLTLAAVVPANESPAATVLVSISPVSLVGMVVPWGMVTVLGATGLGTLAATGAGAGTPTIEARTPPSLGPELTNPSFSTSTVCGAERQHRSSVWLRPNHPYGRRCFDGTRQCSTHFVVLGTEPAHTLFLFDPAGDMEGFFADYAPVLNVEGEPDHKKLAKVYVRHGPKIVGPPLAASSFSS